MRSGLSSIMKRFIIERIDPWVFNVLRFSLCAHAKLFFLVGIAGMIYGIFKRGPIQKTILISTGYWADINIYVTR